MSGIPGFGNPGIPGLQSLATVTVVVQKTFSQKIVANRSEFKGTGSSYLLLSTF